MTAPDDLTTRAEIAYPDEAQTNIRMSNVVDDMRAAFIAGALSEREAVAKAEKLPALDTVAIAMRIRDCSTYNFGMRNADRLAKEDAPALLAEISRLRMALEEANRR